MGAAILSLFWLGGIVLFSHACIEPEPLTVQDACQDARRAIALRSQACESDPGIGNRRLDQAAALPCQGATLNFVCSASILAYTCDQVAAFGDDMNAWVNAQGCVNTGGLNNGLFGAAKNPDGTLPDREVCTQKNFGDCACKIQPDVNNKGVCEKPTTAGGVVPYCCSNGGYPTSGTCTCQRLICVVVGDPLGPSRCQCSEQHNETANATQTVARCSPEDFPTLKRCCIGPTNNGYACGCTKDQECGELETPVSDCSPATFCGGNVAGAGQEVSSCSL